MKRVRYDNYIKIGIHTIYVTARDVGKHRIILSRVEQPN